MKFRMWNGCDRGLCCKAVGRQDKQLNTYDWLADVPGNAESTDLVEVQFKNTRKGYYHNVNNLDLRKGDLVAVEANPGHDIGVVTLTGRLVKLQIKKANLKSQDDIKRIYRIAKQVDLDKWKEAKSREHATMIQSRQIAKDLGLKMKIGDVEYQGDGNKAIFYYIADERVDFRQLIKVLAEAFHVRIEMKQIGARQEAGRIGGTGPCGRELCCATWMKNFVSVSTNAARYQDISLNPQKLAGMCAKLKCCLNYEVDNYVEASRKMPPKDAVLETADGLFYQFKVDILAGLITYSSDKNLASNLETITADRAKEIIELNKNGEKPLSLMENGKVKESSKHIDLLNESDLSRFDKAKKKKKKNKNNNNNNNRQDKEGGNKQERGDRRPKGENRQQQNGGNPQKNGNPNGGNQQKNGNQPKNGNQQKGGNQPNGNRRKDNRNKGPRQSQNGGKEKNEKND
ncbi:PSP1 domain-containing protein [Segatella copri]|uniref:PSP1 domain-containing protein n=1 Tax=Segatella copri TaxID=165179 RepID=UPI0020CA6BAF|nr:regulatory iron-sulfur-containing complex subunit RicT [Segatella copri]